MIALIEFLVIGALVSRVYTHISSISSFIVMPIP
jgi:hypothetical protein